MIHAGWALLLAAGGTALIVLVMVDVLNTTLTLHGAGAVTGRACRAIWRMVMAAGGRHSHQLLSWAGVVVIAFTVIIWISLLWLGWTLVFMAEPGAVVESRSRLPADWSGVAYFAGFTIITLGVGDYVPSAPVWRLLTVVASMNGFFLVTLVITYLLPVINTVVDKRTLAARISALGKTPDEILAQAWNGNDFRSLEQQLSSLVPPIAQLAQSYVAYPVLHYFHAARRATAFPVSVAALDEALTLLTCAVPADRRPDPMLLSTARASIEELLVTLTDTYTIRPVSAAPPLASAFAAQHGWQIPSDAVERLRTRRRLLHTWVRLDGWNWQDVVAGDGR